ncbi:MAG: hypothetical protein WA869_16620 [Alloacidobacterium sp.]
MQTNEIIAALDAEIARLEQVKDLLTGTTSKRTPRQVAPKAAPKKKRHFSAEGLARIAAAQKARWAKVKKTAK